MKKLIYISISVILALSLYIANEFFMPVEFNNEEVEIQISSGMSYHGILLLLENNGMNRNISLLRIYGILSGIDKKIKAGYYIFSRGTSAYDILNELYTGETRRYLSILIIPGSTIWDLAEKFNNQRVINKENFIKTINDEELRKNLKVDSPTLEGYLAPDTYKFPKKYPMEDMIKLMIKNRRSNYPKNFDQRLKELGMSENQVLTLASIIEKEAVADSERPIISGVYHNRLKQGVRLQADPTAIYGVKEYRMGVTKNDLSNNTNYNTYKITGLPPGPIAAPSNKSIIAALYPENVPYLYFVSKHDGTHQFTATYTEHVEAVRKINKK
ncbi:MAG: endolytic transglycosylase MltG [Nitrospirae bacterium]|nr:endolytic transglycosylase MltG [Nitrospirota bacterium]